MAEKIYKKIDIFHTGDRADLMPVVWRGLVFGNNAGTFGRSQLIVDNI
jgi:hypothetical protein